MSPTAFSSRTCYPRRAFASGPATRRRARRMRRSRSPWPSPAVESSSTNSRVARRRPSSAALAAVVAVGSGRLFVEFVGRQEAAVVVAEEDTLRQLRRRVWWLARGAGLDPRPLPVRLSAMKGFRIDERQMLEQLKEE